MSKTRRRKKTRSRASAGNVSTQESVERVAPAGSVGRRRVASGSSLQNTAFALMVALGCLGLAIFFIFFYSEDANHYIYGGVIGLTALGWLVIASRRWSSYRRHAHA